MTVLVGVLCEGGVVIGTDGSATLGSAGMPTIEQPTRKIDIVEQSVIVAGTGAVGLHQRFVAIVSRLEKGGDFRQLPPMEVAKRMSAEARADFESTGALKQRQDRSGGVYMAADYGALVAFWGNGRGQLVELEVHTLQPEFKEESGIWHATMGSGQPIADPFMGMMRRTFCQTGCPELPIGRFITCWALEHTIDLNPGGINDPLSIAVLESKKNVPVAHVLSGQELLEHRSSVEAAYSRLGEYATLFEQSDDKVPS